MEKEFANEDLIQFYTERLQDTGVSSAAALTKAVEACEIDISLDISKKVSLEKQHEIIKNNPSKVAIGEKTYEVTYGYEPYYKKHTATITVPTEEIFEIEQVPALPSGRTLVVKITDAAYEKFSGEDLEKLMTKTEEYLLTKQWEAYRYSSVAPQARKLEGFDPLTETPPELPEPVAFGTNPRTNEPALAYPALTYAKQYWSSDTPYTIIYYKTQPEALEEAEKALAQIEKTKEEKRNKDEHESLAAPAREAMAEVKIMYEQIDTIYKEAHFNYYGLNWSDLSEIEKLVDNLRFEVEDNPSDALKKMSALKARMSSIVEVKEKHDEITKKIDGLIAEKYSTCPLCEKVIVNDLCGGYDHDIKNIKFEVDKYDHVSGPAVLSQIKVVTESEGEKIVARLICSAGTGRRYSKGDVYLERGYDLGSGEKWEGQLGEVVFEDFGRGLTPTERERSKPVTSKIKETGVGSKAETSLEESRMAVAFKKATGSTTVTPVTSILPENEEESAEVSGWKRKKLEDQIKEAEAKVSQRQAELLKALEKEKATALNLSSGEAESEVSIPGTRVVAIFDRNDQDGNRYAEVVEWPTNRVLHLRANELPGPQYVEITDLVENGNFYSKDLGLDGVTLKVKKVDLTENDDVIKIQQDKIRKLNKRLGR